MGTDWRDPRHWRCNNNAHPSRHGTYDGISMHPFETVFLKATWHVGEPHLSHYTRYSGSTHCVLPVAMAQELCWFDPVVCVACASKHTCSPECLWFRDVQTAMNPTVYPAMCTRLSSVPKLQGAVKATLWYSHVQKIQTSLVPLAERRTRMTCRWFLSHADGDPHTFGKFRQAQYRYAIQLEAQDPNNASACFRLPAWEATS